MANTLEQAEARFHAAQEALETFTQENIDITLTGSKFVDESNALDLSKRLAALRAELDRSGAEWYQALEATKVVTRC